MKLKKFGIPVFLVLAGLVLGFVLRAILAPSIWEYSSWGSYTNTTDEYRAGWQDSVIQEGYVKVDGVWDGEADIRHTLPSTVICEKEKELCMFGDAFVEWGHLYESITTARVTEWGPNAIQAVIEDTCGTSTLEINLQSGETSVAAAWNMSARPGECSEAPPGGLARYHLIEKPISGFNKIKQYFVDTFQLGWDPVVTEAPQEMATTTQQ
jgi:hypothetical protein